MCRWCRVLAARVRREVWQWLLQLMLQTVLRLMLVGDSVVQNERERGERRDEREKWYVCVCVCVCERERERVFVCVCVCVQNLADLPEANVCVVALIYGAYVCVCACV